MTQMDVESFEKRCERLIDAVYGGLHNGPTKIDKHADYYWTWCHYGEMATFDFDKLTVLVFMAHLLCVRVSLAGAANKYMRVMLHNRKTREGQMSVRHPDLDQAINEFKRWQVKTPPQTEVAEGK
jgi:hypothetical protein